MITAILLALVCYRITLLIVVDQGPYGIFGKARNYIYGSAALEQGGGINNWWGHWENLANLIDCPHCIGLWVSIILAIFVAANLGHYLTLVFVSSALQSILYDLILVDREHA